MMVVRARVVNTAGPARCSDRSSGVRPRTIVEVGGELADLRARHRLEIGLEQLAVEQVAGLDGDAVDLDCPGGRRS